MWNLKCNTDELIYKTEADVENRFLVSKGAGGIGEGWSESLGLADAD